MKAIWITLAMVLGVLTVSNVNADYFNNGCYHEKVVPSGLGLWLQDTSAENPYIYSKEFSYYIISASNMAEDYTERVVDNCKPIFMATTARSTDKIKEKIDIWQNQIVGVVWDYEFPATPQKVAEADLAEIYQYAHNKGLLFGIAVLSNPERSLSINGIDYARVHNFADFLMPMLYCQAWGCKESQTAGNYSAGVALSRVPLVQIIALETISDTYKEPVLSIGSMSSNYGTLGPVPLSMCFWNAANLDMNYIGTALKIMFKK